MLPKPAVVSMPCIGRRAEYISSWVGRLDYRLVIALMCSKLEGVPMEALSWALVRLSILRLLLRFRLPLGE